MARRPFGDSEASRWRRPRTRRLVCHVRNSGVLRKTSESRLAWASSLRRNYAAACSTTSTSRPATGPLCNRPSRPIGKHVRHGPPWRNARVTVYRSDITYGPQPIKRGHWLDRLPAIDKDLAAMEALLQTDSKRRVTPDARVKQAILASTGKPQRPSIRCTIRLRNPSSQANRFPLNSV